MRSVCTESEFGLSFCTKTDRRGVLEEVPFVAGGRPDGGIGGSCSEGGGPVLPIGGGRPGCDEDRLRDRTEDTVLPAMDRGLSPELADPVESAGEEDRESAGAEDLDLLMWMVPEVVELLITSCC